ncbi:sensor histidine kinase [Actinoplanes sp. N902-109]|uniref:sensor histidine kinase n=1 Tax=Actinoplanes sp. (strain N902-109) TaxID=649831 RepID=UPI00032951C5|nr:sensor histidine kinase [Actinoplanes sp. N902-109]AGL19619.1 histidine kinase [Actinoplanes sp. N902-109]
MTGDMTDRLPPPEGLMRRLRLVLPYAALLAATGLTIAARNDPDVDHQSLPVSVACAALTAGWLLWFVTGHPRWQDSRPLMTVFFAGLLALIGLLIWTNPLYGFFAWTGYLFTLYALRGRWRFAGTAAIGTLTAISQMGGFGVLGDRDATAMLLVVVALNVSIGTAMTFLSVVTDRHHERRAVMLDELAEANRKLAAAMAENAGLHTQLLVQAREAGVLDERQRLAGEIHDVLAQGLTGIVTQLEAADQAASAGGPEAGWRRHLDAAKKLARDSLAEARRSVQALRPHQLDTAALPDALRELSAGWAARHHVAAELITTGTPRSLLPEIEAALLRTAQEALTNVARHASARRVALTLSYMEDLVTLDVRDDGSGFDPAAPRVPAADGGYGLTAMRDRVQRVAGTLEIESEPGAGTAISACVPAIRLRAAA